MLKPVDLSKVAEELKLLVHWLEILTTAILDESTFKAKLAVRRPAIEHTETSISRVIAIPKDGDVDLLDVDYATRQTLRSVCCTAVSLAGRLENSGATAKPWQLSVYDNIVRMGFFADGRVIGRQVLRLDELVNFREILGSLRELSPAELQPPRSCYWDDATETRLAQQVSAAGPVLAGERT